MTSTTRPLHPYDIMLCHVSKHLTGHVEMMHRLGRLMGCRDTRDVKCPSLLFLKLEEAGVLSEFSAVTLRNALELIDLPKAAIIVKEYEDYLSGQEGEVASSGDSCNQTKPSTPSTDDASDRPTPGGAAVPESLPPPYSSVHSCDEHPSPLSGHRRGDGCAPPSVPTVSSSGTGGGMDGTPQLEGEIKGELNSMDTQPETTGIRRKYHTVNPSTMQRDYPDVRFDFFQKRN